VRELKPVPSPAVASDPLGGRGEKGRRLTERNLRLINPTAEIPKGSRKNSDKTESTDVTTGAGQGEKESTHKLGKQDLKKEKERYRESKYSLLTGDHKRREKRYFAGH